MLPVTGKVIVRVRGKKVTNYLSPSENGRSTVRLPKMRRGKHNVSATFMGTGTVQRSGSHPVKLIVQKKKHRKHRK